MIGNLKGKTVIELTDVNTGEVERVEDNNMFTLALDSLFNLVPWWFSNSAVYKPQSNWAVNAMTPIIGNAIGGLLLFPEEMEENENIIFAPSTNKPTAIASFDGYTGEDTRRGSYNEIESGKISNGFRFVWDFPTSAGNGVIKCAALTSVKGGAGYFDSGENIIKESRTSDSYPVGVAYSVPTNSIPWNNGFGADDNGIYFKNGDNRKAICRVNTSKSKYNLFGSPVEYEKLGEVDDDGSPCLYNGEVWIIRNTGNASGNATVNIDIYNPDTWEKRTQTIVVAAPLRASLSYRATCVSNGYLYLLGYDSTKFYKVNINNPADVIEIPRFTTTYGKEASLCAFNGGAIGNDILIEADGTPHSISMYQSVPIAVSGVWVLTVGYRDTDRRTFDYGITALMPYIATINNINPVIKGASQTMKVTYEVTEG